VENTMVRQDPACSPHGCPQQSRSPPAARGGPHAGAGGCPKEAVIPWGAHAGSGCWRN